MNSGPVCFIVCPGVKSSEGHIFTAVNILNGIQNFDAFRQGPLECLAAGYQLHASGPLVNDRRANRTRQGRLKTALS